MSNSQILLYLTTIISFFFVIYESTRLIIHSKNLNKTEGTVVDFKYTFPESMLIRNSKYVTVCYFVDGKKIISKNRIRVSSNYNIGDSITIKYFIDNPKQVYTGSINTIYIGLFIGIISSLLIYF